MYEESSGIWGNVSKILRNNQYYHIMGDSGEEETYHKDDNVYVLREGLTYVLKCEHLMEGDKIISFLGDPNHE